MKVAVNNTNRLPSIPVVMPLKKAPDPKMMQQFWDCVVHELRSCISAMAAGCDLVATGNKPMILKAMKTGATDALRILTDMTTTIAVNTDRLTVSCTITTLPIAAWLLSTVSAYENLHQPEHKKIELDIHPDLINASIMADTVKLKQVIDNLLSNAFKFSDTELIKVGAQPDGEYIAIYVVNHGKTIPEEAQELLFTPYHRLDNGLAGTGIGLYIANLYTEAMGGAMAVASKDDTTMFTVLLPVAPTNQTQKL